MNNYISLYIPAYNAEKTIEKSIKSILQQTLIPKEIIVINDCSTDKTLSLLKNFNQVKIINNTKNYGLAKSRNVALECSKYDFSTIDPDVVCDENWLEIFFNTMKEKQVDEGGKLIDKYIEEPANHWRSYYLKRIRDEKLIIRYIFSEQTHYLIKKDSKSKY